MDLKDRFIKQTAALMEAQATFSAVRQFVQAHNSRPLLKMIDNTIQILDDAIHPDEEKEKCACGEQVWIGHMKMVNGELRCPACFIEEAHFLKNVMEGL